MLEKQENKMINMPILVTKIVSTLKQAHPSISTEILLTVTISKLFEMFSAKRICFNESGNIQIPNWFSLVFLPSGGGKDRLVDNLDKLVLKDFFNWFTEKGNEAIEKCDNENYKKFKLINEVQDATTEGLALLGKMMKDINFGSIYVKISEFGLYIKNGDNRKKQFLGDLCHLYSNKIPNKVIKSEIFRDEITGIPTNVLAYSDYTLFLNDIKSYFEKILNTGYCRRFIINFQEKIKLSSTYLSDEQERQIYEELEQVGYSLFQLFKNIADKSCYKLLPSAKTILNQYKIRNNTLHNKEENPLLQRELNSRELKALKLSCLFAILNHPKELVINETDIEQAISAIDFLSQDFKRFLKYEPAKDDKYQQIFKYWLEHVGKEFSKGELMNILISRYGFSREPLRRNLHNELYVLYDIARDNDYTILKNKTKNKNGSVYSLVPYEFQMNTRQSFICDCGKKNWWD